MTHPLHDRINGGTSIEELVREFFASDFDALPAVGEDFLSGSDVSSLVEVSQDGDDTDEDDQDALYTEVTQRALLHIPVSESELDRRLNADTK